MSKHFFRLQEAGIQFGDMIDFVSADGGDGMEEGLCVTDRIGNNFGGAEYAYRRDDAAEVVVMEAEIIVQIYDGYRVRPTREIARFSYAQWLDMVDDGTAYEYE